MLAKSNLILIFSILSLSLIACTDRSSSSGSADDARRAKLHGTLKAADELEDVHIETLQAGEGKGAMQGQKLKVHYEAWVYDPYQPEGKGDLFDSSLANDTPFEFVLGQDSVITGWETGLIGIKPQEKRRLIVPSRLAYGQRGAGRAVPPNSAVVYEVTLISATTVSEVE